MFCRVDFSITEVPQFHTSVFCKSQNSKVKLCNQFLMNYKSLTTIGESINSTNGTQKLKDLTVKFLA